MPSFFFHIAIEIDTQYQGLQTPSGPHAAHTLPKPGLSGDLGADTVVSNGDTVATSTNTQNLSSDWRYDRISLQNVTMAPTPATSKHGSNDHAATHITNGISAGPGGLATKGRYEPCDPPQEELGWGVVRLYRDAEETPGLYEDPTSPKHARSGRGLVKTEKQSGHPFQDEDCTTLCILAVPSYLTPSDFLGFVGEKTRDEVSHFRMIRTERGNRYMVLMKFRNGKKAREWRNAWNGKAFDGMEPENCHVVFVKSIDFQTHEQPGHESSFPDMTNDPFTPSVIKASQPTSLSASLQATTLSSSSTTRSTKPKAPPTPALVELPTCPVCLERMDESTGLLTILCQHVFHCSCLQKWRGSGCPVCRYTQDDLSHRKINHTSTSSAADTGLNECSICHSDANLWICLICGSVGCGRYDAAHAFAHYESSSHCFAMDLTTQRVWDYASDGYVHRIAQNKSDGKLVSLPQEPTSPSAHAPDDDFDDYVPREKLDNIGLEYTHLLTSQLDSQRLYFEEIVERAADKATRASLSAETALAASTATAAQLSDLQTSHSTLLRESIPALERDRDRLARRAEKYESMARTLEKEWRDEKAMNESLMARISHVNTQLEQLQSEKKDLEEQNRDLGFFISGGAKLQELGGGEEVEGGVVSLPPVGEEKGGGKTKGKGRGKGKGTT